MESHAVTNSILETQHHFSRTKSKWQRYTKSIGAAPRMTQAFSITAFRQYVAEFVGTLLFIYAGTGTAVALAAKDQLASGSTNTCIALSFGFGVACMVYATANVSGGHLNPAITIAFFCTGNIDPIRGIFYVISQCAGAIGASALIRATTPSDSYKIVAGGATRLGAGISVVQGLFLELIITYMLIFTVFGTVQLRNTSTGMGKLAGLSIGLAVLVSHTFGQSFTGPGMNPARSLGPAIVFSEWSNHWIYWVGPITGGILAALSYQFVLQPEDKERRDVRYQEKMIVKQQRNQLKQQKQALHPRRRVSDILHHHPVSRNSAPLLYKPVHTADRPFTIDDKEVVAQASADTMLPMDLDKRDSIDQDNFTMDVNSVVGQHSGSPVEDPNGTFSPNSDSILNNPGTTRIM